MLSFNALTLSHHFLREHIKRGDICIDATAGRGGDTAFLCSLVGETGRVLAFDVQRAAIESTTKRLSELGLSDRVQVILDGHEHMEHYAETGTVKAIVFNLGWLPGGDHTLFTKPETSIAALEAALRLLRPDGVISLCIYYGRETGFVERDALLSWLREVNPRECSVLLNEFINRPGCPPIAAFLLKGI